MSDQSSRTLPATPRRREAARRAGMAAPADLPAWAASAATAILLAPAWARATIPAAADAVCETFSAALAGGGSASGPPFAVAVILPTLGLIAASAAAGLAVRLACDGWSWQPGRASLNLSRIDPLAGLGRIFSSTTLVSLAYAAIGLVVLVFVAVIAARPLGAVQATPAEPGGGSLVVMVAWLAIAWLVATAVIIAIGQWLLARRRFERQIRMTPQELTEEMKDLQADPRVKRLQQK